MGAGIVVDWMSGYMIVRFIARGETGAAWWGSSFGVDRAHSHTLCVLRIHSFSVRMVCNGLGLLHCNAYGC